MKNKSNNYQSYFNKIIRKWIIILNKNINQELKAYKAKI